MLLFTWLLVMSLIAKSLHGKRGDTPKTSAEGDSPQILDLDRDTYRVKLNETICLPCKVKKQYTDTARKCLFYWTKNKTVVLEDRSIYRLKIKINRCLLIKNIRSSDHAKYECVAKSPLGMSKAVRNLIVTNRDLDVTYIPEVKEDTQNHPSAVPVPPFFRPDTLERKAELIRKFFYLGKRAKLKCAITGEPRPKIKWFHNGVSLEGSTWVHIRSRSFALIIDQFTKHHAGNYTCVASNGKGNISMAFIVSIKVGDPNPPRPTTGERIVSEGDNVTLRCKKPAKKVKYLLWDVPKRMRSDLEKARHRGRDPSRSQPPRSVADNGSIVKLLYLYNITDRKNAGEYRCLAVYKRTREPVPVKIIHLKVKSDDKIALTPDNSPNNEILLVKIAVPVMGSVLTLFVVIICFRCRRKTSLNNSAKAKADDEDDALSMQILPSIPTGTLRIHKSLQEFTGNDATRFPDVVSSRDTESTNTAECEKTSKTGTSPPRKLFYDNSRKTHTKRHTKIKCTKSNSNNTNNINNNSNENVYSPCETEEQLKLQTNSLDNLDNDQKLIYNTNEHKEVASDKLPSSESLHSSCCRVDNNVRMLDSPVLHAEDDLLLQREIKNWESLIRESKSYRCEKNVNDGNLLLSHSDCSRRIIT